MRACTRFFIHFLLVFVATLTLGCANKGELYLTEPTTSTTKTDKEKEQKPQGEVQNQ